MVSHLWSIGLRHPKKRREKTYVAVELKVVGDAVGASAVDILGDNKGLALDRARPLCILRLVLNLGCLCRRQTQRQCLCARVCRQRFRSYN